MARRNIPAPILAALSVLGTLIVAVVSAMLFLSIFVAMGALFAWAVGWPMTIASISKGFFACFMVVPMLVAVLWWTVWLPYQGKLREIRFQRAQEQSGELGEP